MELVTQLSDQDRVVIQLLQQDARMSYHEIASRLGTSPSTARRRVERLIEDDVIKLVAVPRWPRLGFGLIALIGVSVELSKYQDVSEALAAMEEICWIAVTTGEFDFVAQLVLPNNEDLVYFINKRVSTIDGIQDLHTLMVPQFIKSFDEYRLPRWPYRSAKATGDVSVDGTAPDVDLAEPINLTAERSD